MLEVLDLLGGVDAERHGHLLLFAVRAADVQDDVLSRRDVHALKAGDVYGLGAVEAERLGVDVVLELEREHAHADEV